MWCERKYLFIMFTIFLLLFIHVPSKREITENGYWHRNAPYLQLFRVIIMMLVKVKSLKLFSLNLLFSAAFSQIFLFGKSLYDEKWRGKSKRNSHIFIYTYAVPVMVLKVWARINKYTQTYTHAFYDLLLV